MLGLIGCGAQAVTQLHALSRVFALREVVAYDVDQQACRSFPARAAALGLRGVRVTAAPLDEVTRRADILCTATSVDLGCGPVFEDRELRQHVHVNAVGSDFPGKVELPLRLLKRSLVCPDFRTQAIAEGECQQLSDEEIGPSLVDLVSDAQHYADRRTQPTVFDSTGWALEDHVIVDMLVRYGNELGCGTALELEAVCEDARDPYGFITDGGSGTRKLRSVKLK